MIAPRVPGTDQTTQERFRYSDMTSLASIEMETVLGVNRGVVKDIKGDLFESETLKIGR